MPLSVVLCNMKGISEVAEELGLSARMVRNLVAHGQLPGERVGRSWVINDSDLRRFQERRRPSGRPWQPSSAWALLAQVASDLEVEISPVQRSRARQRLADVGIAGLLPQLRNRAIEHRYYAHPSALRRIADEPGVVLAGVSAAPHVGADLIDIANELDVYVDEAQVQRLVQKYALEANSDRPNLFARVVRDRDWPFPAGMRVAPLAVVAVDLLEHGDPRASRAGRVLAGAT